jgi:hypothetical protein
MPALQGKGETPPAIAHDTTNSQAEGSQGMDAKGATQAQLVTWAIQTIINCFRLEPPKDPDRAVQLLDNGLGLPREMRIKLAPSKQQLFDWAEMTLADHFEEEPDKRKQSCRAGPSSNPPFLYHQNPPSRLSGSFTKLTVFLRKEPISPIGTVNARSHEPAKRG